MRAPARYSDPSVPMGWYRLEVRAVQPLTPHLTRVTLTGPDAAGFTDAGPDQRCKLFLPRPGQDEPELPRGAGMLWYAHWKAQPARTRAIMRTYTIRAARPDAAEVDIDFALHEHRDGGTDSGARGGTDGDGPATAWARAARPGDRVGLFGCRAEFEPPAGSDGVLLVADEAALPAVAAILDRVPAGEHDLRAYVSVATAADRLPLAHADRVTWLPRDEDASRDLVQVVRDADLPGTRPYVWVAGESETVTTVRRHLVRERGLPRSAVTFTGYWRRGAAVDGD